MDHTGTTADVVPPELRRAYEAQHLVPLWESATSEKFKTPVEEPHIWRWSDMQPIVLETGKIRAEHVLDRRVLLMTKPGRHHRFDEAASGQIYCTFQMVLPGERAQAHRHPMNALRFVVQAGPGAKSFVDGKECRMEPGDLILTPGWTWHEHVNDGDTPMIWMDVLDVGLHYVLGTTAFQPGPMREQPEHLPDAAFVRPGIAPRVRNLDEHRPHSPMFRYPWADTVEGLAATPPEKDGSRTVRYVNPLDGGPCMDLLDCSMVELEPGRPTTRFRTSAFAVCHVKEGRGRSRIGDTTIEWGPNDIFTLPARQWASHEAEGGVARLFQVSNREVYRRLGLLTEAWED